MNLSEMYRVSAPVILISLVHSINFNFQRYRTPSRSRSRSGTPLHWKKEEARVIKLSDYEKIEAERKREEKKEKHDQSQKTKFSNSNDSKDFEESNDKIQNKEVDYNALDYEDNENHSDYEQETSHKQVSSLVQYPLPGTYQLSQQQATSNGDDQQGTNGEVQLNKRSEVMAMALGVQIKTGEDPATGEIKMSGFEKKNRNTNELNFADMEYDDKRSLKVSALSSVHRVETTNNQFDNRSNDLENKRGERNKFETEKANNDPSGRGHRARYGQMDYYKNDRDRRYDFLLYLVQHPSTPFSPGMTIKRFLR